jgi:hypothetical protein
VAEHGADLPVSELLWLLSADCPKRIAGQWHDVCAIHLLRLFEVAW